MVRRASAGGRTLYAATWTVKRAASEVGEISAVAAGSGRGAAGSDEVTGGGGFVATGLGVFARGGGGGGAVSGAFSSS